MLQLQVVKLVHEAEGVLGIELRDPRGHVLPSFSAGGHIDVYMPGGLCRQYSLTNDPHERYRYCLGVALAVDSRGGSRYLHEQLKVGMHLNVGEPRSLFGLDPSAHEHLFIAGGIGITPILSMIRECELTAKPWRLMYCVRSRSRAAYLWDLASKFQQVTLHVDEEQGGVHPDVSGFLTSAYEGTHVYCCGPSPLMDAVAKSAAKTPILDRSVHFERFTARQETALSEQSPFKVILARRKMSLQVKDNETILETLERTGISVPFGCREGLCGACETTLIKGDVDHRDFILTEEKREENSSIVICVSRARTGDLVLDI